MANIQFTVIPAAAGAQGSVARYLATIHQFLPTAVDGLYTLGMVVVYVVGELVTLVGTRVSLHYDETVGISQLFVVLGLVVMFTSGSAQVGLATDPLEVVSEISLQLPSIYLLALGDGGILPGAWARGPRLIQAVSNEYTSLGLRRSITALIPAFLIAQFTIVLGVSTSFNKVMIVNIVRGGLAASSSGGSGVSPRKVGITIRSWVGSMLDAGVISYGLYLLSNAASVVG